MKLVRFGEFRRELPGVLLESGVRKDCSGLFADWDTAFFADGGLERLAMLDFASLPDVRADSRWGAPVARPGKIVCLAGNYRAHCDESSVKVTPEPVIFMKAPNAVVGPYDNIVIPKNSVKTDWEVELGVVVGREARYLDSQAEAAAHIAGYTISHDVSERCFQTEHHGQYTKGKSCDTFNPLGPYLAVASEISDPMSLELSLQVNGETRQRSNTAEMIFPPAYLVYYISQFMTLEPGDVISTGTPAGVGAGMNPPQFLKAGDIVELAISGLGTQRQTCAAYRP